MNDIMKRLLEKISVKDLFDEVKGDDKLIYNLGMTYFQSNRKVFIKTVIALFNEIVNGDDESLKKKLKEYIIEMDEDLEFSINKKKKAKAATSTKSKIDDDPCSRGGFGSRITRC